MKNYKRLLTYMRPYIKKFVLAVVCIIFAAAANLYVPWIIKDMIDDVLADKNMALLNAICIGIVVIFFLRGIFYFGQSYLVSYIGQKVIIDVREVMFRKFQRMPLAYYDQHQTGEIMSFVTNDVAAIQSALVDNLIELVTEGCILIGSLALMFYLDWKLSLLTLVVIPMVGQAMKIFGRKIKKSSTVIQERLAEITALLQESFSATRVVKSFVREDYEIARFVASNQRNFEAVMKNVQQTSMLTPTVEFLAALAVTFIVWFGGYEVVNGDITAGAFVAFLTYAVNLANPVKRLSRIYGNLQKAMAAVDRVFSVVDLTESITDRPDAKPLPPVTGHVCFEDVTFSYKEGRKALDGVTLEAAPGEMIAFVGPSGAGKSTIANLIPRFYEPDSGAITVDGHDIRSVTLASLRGQIERKEAQLNSGEGLTSRDLMALQEEIAGLRSLLEQAADAEFAALEAEEEAEAEVARIDREIAALKERVLQGRARLEDDVARIIAQRREIQAERDALFAPLADDLKEAYERARSHGGYAVMGMRPDGSTGAGVRFSPLEVARIRALPDDALYVSEDYDCIVVRLEG